MTSDGLRQNVVLIVVIAIALLTVGLYGSAVGLIGYGKSVPGELWLAAGNASGALIALLINTKHDAPAEVQVVNTPEDPVPVEQPDLP